MRFTATTIFFTCALMGTTAIAANCAKDLYYCGSSLLKKGMHVDETSNRSSHWSILYQAIIITKSMMPWVQLVRAKILTTSIIRFSSASPITIPTAISSSSSSVEMVVRIQALGIVIIVNRKCIGEFCIYWPYHIKPNCRFWGHIDRVPKNIHGRFQCSPLCIL